MIFRSCIFRGNRIQTPKVCCEFSVRVYFLRQSFRNINRRSYGAIFFTIDLPFWKVKSFFFNSVIPTKFSFFSRNSVGLWRNCNTYRKGFDFKKLIPSTDRQHKGTPAMRSLNPKFKGKSPLRERRASSITFLIAAPKRFKLAGNFELRPYRKWLQAVELSNETKCKPEPIESKPPQRRLQFQTTFSLEKAHANVKSLR